MTECHRDEGQTTFGSADVRHVWRGTLKSTSDVAEFGMQDSFATTQWSTVLAAAQRSPEAAQALAALCRTYWYPLYAYVRRRTADRHEAQDLTQAFFAYLLEKDAIATASPDRGLFRAFLLTACKRFLANEWRNQRRLKRGGDRKTFSLDFEAADVRFSALGGDSLTPEAMYDREWAVSLLDSVLLTVRNDYEARGKAELFEALKDFLSGEREADGYAGVVETLDLTEGAVRVAVHRLRTRYRDCLRSEIARTVETPDEVEDEIRRLFEILGSPA